MSDALLISCYYAYLSRVYEYADDVYSIKILQVLIILFAFIKLTFYLRMFEELSFLVMMLQATFYDLRYFLFFFALVIGAFTLCLGILVGPDSDTYQGIGLAGYYVMAFRTSIGDYNLDNYASNSDFKILTWIFWFVVMIVGNVIFMNFIIAVVN